MTDAVRFLHTNGEYMSEVQDEDLKNPKRLLYIVNLKAFVMAWQHRFKMTGPMQS